MKPYICPLVLCIFFSNLEAGNDDQKSSSHETKKETTDPAALFEQLKKQKLNTPILKKMIKLKEQLMKQEKPNSTVYMAHLQDKDQCKRLIQRIALREQLTIVENENGGYAQKRKLRLQLLNTYLEKEPGFESTKKIIEQLDEQRRSYLQNRITQVEHNKKLSDLNRFEQMMQLLKLVEQTYPPESTERKKIEKSRKTIKPVYQKTILTNYINQWKSKLEKDESNEVITVGLKVATQKLVSLLETIDPTSHELIESKKEAQKFKLRYKLIISPDTATNLRQQSCDNITLQKLQKQYENKPLTQSGHL